MLQAADARGPQVEGLRFRPRRLCKLPESGGGGGGMQHLPKWHHDGHARLHSSKENCGGPLSTSQVSVHPRLVRGDV